MAMEERVTQFMTVRSSARTAARTLTAAAAAAGGSGEHHRAAGLAARWGMDRGGARRRMCGDPRVIVCADEERGAVGDHVARLSDPVPPQPRTARQGVSVWRSRGPGEG
eukprot:360653-Chlamydomonas_euryale.AAC.3